VAPAPPQRPACPLSAESAYGHGTYRGRNEIFGFFGRLAEETGGTFRLEVHDLPASHEHAVAPCWLTASRRGKPIQIPVANVSHVRNGKVTEFWGATIDPQPSTGSCS
jgi:uncharacterized protein